MPSQDISSLIFPFALKGLNQFNLVLDNSKLHAGTNESSLFLVPLTCLS